MDLLQNRLRVANRLVQLRFKRKLTRNRLATLIGYSHSYVNDIEKGYWNKRPAFILQYSQVFNIPIERLIKPKEWEIVFSEYEYGTINKHLGV